MVVYVCLVGGWKMHNAKRACVQKKVASKKGKWSQAKPSQLTCFYIYPCISTKRKVLFISQVKSSQQKDHMAMPPISTIPPPFELPFAKKVKSKERDIKSRRKMLFLSSEAVLLIWNGYSSLCSRLLLDLLVLLTYFYFCTFHAASMICFAWFACKKKKVTTKKYSIFISYHHPSLLSSSLGVFVWQARINKFPAFVWECQLIYD